VGAPVLIHGGVVVNADQQFPADVLMENGIIVAVGSNLQAPSTAIRIDASGK
jgi:dihydropyrimidinase